MKAINKRNVLIAVAVLALIVFVWQHVAYEIRYRKIDNNIEAVKIDRDFDIYRLRKALGTELWNAEELAEKYFGKVPDKIRNKIEGKKSQIKSLIRDKLIQKSNKALASGDRLEIDFSIYDCRGNEELFTGKDLDEIRNIGLRLTQTYNKLHIEHCLEKIGVLMARGKFEYASNEADYTEKWVLGQGISLPDEFFRLKKRAKVATAKKKLADARKALKEKDLDQAWDKLLSSMRYFKEAGVNPVPEYFTVKEAVMELAKRTEQNPK
jgi:hypothetical protein